ncbi:MAG TPA: hypothetical protein VFS92_08705 [Planctomycetota bacterium]|nr:hypothetical protein [Planctomycetota bacterium]
MGPKGLNVLAITHEPREQVLKYLAQDNPAPMTYAIGVGGGLTLTNDSGKIPYSWLISAEGKVVWQGTGSPSNKLIEEEIKKVKFNDAMKAARAQKALDYAEALIGEKHLVRAIRILEKVAKEAKAAPEIAKKAEERKAAVEKDESLKAELAAQKALDKMVTGLEMPKEKIKKKVRESTAAQLEAFIKSNKESAPAAAAMAEMWAKVMQQKWQDYRDK